jgi:hypothetical protein
VFERLRELSRRTPLLTGSIALFWVVHSVADYPTDYLFRLDREIWFVQLGTWALLIGEGVALGLLASGASEFLRRRILALSPSGPVGNASLRLTRALDSRWAPAAAGILAAGTAWWSWGSLHPLPIIHDEAAYLLQARLFAGGHWRGPAAPIPEFFEQMYVFVSPFMAAKYPPGYSLALVPGIWLHAPALVPVILVGIAGALLFSLARSLANSWVAALAWLLWRSNPDGRFLPPVYMSEQLSTVLWLSSWWAFARWRKSHELRYLLLVAAGLGWGAITRPLTLLAAAIPIGAIVVGDAARERRWRPLLTAGAVGAAILLLLPLWNQKTTGDWRVSPLALHVAWYTPYDVGFGAPALPLRTLPPDLAQVAKTLGRSRIQHTIRRIPQLIFERSAYIRGDAFPGWRIVLVPVLIYALCSIRAAGLVAALTIFIDFALHLPINHPANVSKYYLETYPVLVFLAAAGVWMTIVETAPTRALDSRRATAGLFLMLLFLAPCVESISRLRGSEFQSHAPKTKFRALLEALPARSVVFVRYSPSHITYRSLIENDADLAREKVWLVYDRGADNARLRAAVPDRTPYLYDGERALLFRLNGPLTEEQKRIAGPSASPATATVRQPAGPVSAASP